MNRWGQSEDTIVALYAEGVGRNDRLIALARGEDVALYAEGVGRNARLCI